MVHIGFSQNNLTLWCSCEGTFPIDSQLTSPSDITSSPDAYRKKVEKFSSDLEHGVSAFGDWDGCVLLIWSWLFLVAYQDTWRRDEAVPDSKRGGHHHNTIARHLLRQRR
jgi:hypothetical protein